MNTAQIEMTKIYWEEYKYRHEHYWKSFFKFSFAALFLNILPFAYPEKMVALKRFLIVFPLVSLGLSIFSTWLLAAEYERMRVIYKKFDEIKTKEFKYIRFNLSGCKRILKLRIGTVVTILFLLGFSLMSITEICFFTLSRPNICASDQTVDSNSQTEPS